MKIISVILLTLSSIASNAQVPSWAKNNTINKNGSIVTSICEGKGSSLSIARQDAIQNCQISVSQFLAGEVKINSVSTETEKDIGFHQQIEQNLNIKKFACDPIKDEVIQSGDSYTFWIKCKFDISKAEITETQSTENKLDDIGLKPTNIVKANDLTDGQVLLIESIPQCDSLLVKGTKARIINCQTNPVKAVIYKSDSELIIRLKDYQPKTIKLNGGNSNEKISVLLERN